MNRLGTHVTVYHSARQVPEHEEDAKAALRL